MSYPIKIEFKIWKKPIFWTSLRDQLLSYAWSSYDCHFSEEMWRFFAKIFSGRVRLLNLIQINTV